MQEYERNRLLERVDRDAATVGASIPAKLSIDGETIDLAAFVHKAGDPDNGPPAERVRAVIRGLRAERQRRRTRIEEGEVEKSEAESLADSILGIDRALTALESTGETDIEAESERRKQADRKRWLSFVDSVTGEDPSRDGEKKQ